MAKDDQSGSARGFLFADLRGYTRFVERQGDAAGAELLARYRVLVRGVLAETGGAEIRTEGDSFYLVFPSARRAVMAGLALVERAGADSLDHRDAPIEVGVGIHAGETTETAEGYVGSAVNIAARICATARPGEVLVSDTVRSLTRTGVPVDFVPRGRPRLKGIDEPIALFAAQRPGAVRAVSPALPLVGRRVSLWMAGGGAAIVVLALAAISTGLIPPSLGGSHASATPTLSVGLTGKPTPTPLPSGLAFTRCAGGALKPQVYLTRCFQPQFAFRAASGWNVYAEDPTFLLLNWIDAASGCSTDVESGKACTLWVMHFTSGYRDCSNEVEPVGAGRDAILDWFKSDQALTQVSTLSSSSALGPGALQVEFERSSACSKEQMPFFDIFGGAVTPFLLPDDHVRLVVVDVGGTTISALIISTKARFPGYAAIARPLIESVDFGGG